MKIETASFILAGAVIISVIATVMVFHLVPSHETEELEMRLQVSDYVGFDVETSAIVFGTVPPGGMGQRDIIINNLADEPRNILIRAEGGLSEWVSVSENMFLVLANEEKPVSVHVQVPEDAEFGNYTGTMKIHFFPL